MRELPIVFTAESVGAILDNRKTQTRRVWKKQPYMSRSNPPMFTDTAVGDLFVCPDLLPTTVDRGWVITECTGRGSYRCMGAQQFIERHSRYQVGDHLWVLESWQCGTPALPNGLGIHPLQDGYKPTPDLKVIYRADGDDYIPAMAWRSPRYMPRWASRITLEVTEVRVQRVQDISEEDALAEGISEDSFRDIIFRGNRFSVAPEHWIHGDDEGRSFCKACAKKEIRRLKKIDPSRELMLDGGWDTDGDTPAACETCGRPLSNTFTDYCASEELAIFEERGFDVKSPADCYIAQQIIGSQLWSGGKNSPRIHKLAYGALWDSINAKRGYPWANNNWVFAYTFQRVHA